MPRTLDDTLDVLLDQVCPHGLIEVTHETTSAAVAEMAAVNGYVAFIATEDALHPERGTIVLVRDPDTIESIRSCLADLGVAYIEPQEA